MTNQPSDIDPTPAKASLQVVVNGGNIATRREKGAILRVTWGIGAAKEAAIAELAAARGGTMAHTITYTDLGGDPQSFDILWTEEPQYKFRVGDFLDRFTIVFVERP